jgi:hypothetical protein
VMWLAWVPNLIVAEMIVQRRRTTQHLIDSNQVALQA